MQSRSVIWWMIGLLLWAGPDLSLQQTTIEVELTSASFSLSNAEIAGGVLTLDSRNKDATALYKDAVALASSSFSTVFTFSTNASFGNGTFAFVVVPSDSLDSLETARKTLSVEFNSTYYVSSYHNGDDSPHNGGGWLRPSDLLPFGGLKVSSYVDGDQLQQQLPIWTSPPGCYSSKDEPYFCPARWAAGMADAYPSSFQYQLALEYNITTRSLAVGTLGCASSLDPSIGTFATFLNYSVDLSSVVKDSMFLGFVATDGAIFNVSQWNFTTNPTSSIITSLALQTSSAGTGTGGDGTASRTTGSSSDGHSKLGKGYVIAFSLIGAGIGVASVVLVCFLCRRKPRASTSRVRGEIPEGAIIFDAAKAGAPPPRRDHHDTAPLQPRPVADTPDFALTGTASWLKRLSAR